MLALIMLYRDGLLDAEDLPDALLPQILRSLDGIDLALRIQQVGAGAIGGAVMLVMVVSAVIIPLRPCAPLAALAHPL